MPRKTPFAALAAAPFARPHGLLLGALLPLLVAANARASEAELVIPDLGSVTFLGVSGRVLLFAGIAVCGLGLGFGLAMYRQLQAMPVHRSMREISELIYETCKTYLLTQ